MRGLPVFLFFAMIIAALFAFSGAFSSYPLYYSPVTVAPYQFAGFLFWMFMLLFLAAILFGAAGRRWPSSPAERAESARELSAQEDTITGGFSLVLFLLVIAVISGLFGFGVVASAVAGLAMIIFWIAVAVGVVAVAMGLYDHNDPRSHMR